MVDLAEIQTAYYMVAATGVLIAAAYYVLNIRTTQRNMKQTLDTRQVQLFMGIYQRFMEPDFQNMYWDTMSWQWKDFEDFLAKYGQESKPEAFKVFTTVGTYFEGLGVLGKRGFIDHTIVDDLMSLHIIGWWQKFEPVCVGYRKLWNTPTVMEHGEDLYNEIYGIWKQQHPQYDKPTISQ